MEVAVVTAVLVTNSSGSSTAEDGSECCGVNGVTIISISNAGVGSDLVFGV
jgi:hypothetical protein